MPIPSPAGVRRSSSTSSKSVGQRFRGCSGRRPRAWERGVGWINFWIQERKIIDSILTADGWGAIHRFRKQQIGEDLAHVGAILRGVLLEQRPMNQGDMQKSGGKTTVPAYLARHCGSLS